MPSHLQAALDEDEGPEELGGRGGGKRREREEDEFYQEAKAAAGALVGLADTLAGCLWTRSPPAACPSALPGTPAEQSPVRPPPTAASKKAKRKETYTYAETLPPAEDPTAAGARGITRGEFRTSIDFQRLPCPSLVPGMPFHVSRVLPCPWLSAWTPAAAANQQRSPAVPLGCSPRAQQTLRRTGA